jgi:hypothetical protein
MKDTNGSKSKNSQTHSNSVVFVLQVNNSILNQNNAIFSIFQSKLATMSNDFKQVLEARTQVCHNIALP